LLTSFPHAYVRKTRCKQHETHI